MQVNQDLPENADHYVMVLMMGICEKYGFTQKPEKLGYSNATVKGEKIGVIRFIQQKRLPTP